MGSIELSRLSHVPRSLIGKGRDEEAVEVLNYIAEQNGTVNTITVEQLQNVYVEVESGVESSLVSQGSEGKADAPSTKGQARHVEAVDESKEHGQSLQQVPVAKFHRTPWLNVGDLKQLRRSLQQYDKQHMKMLFASRRMALNTLIIMFCWSAIGIAYPLFNAFIGT